MFTYYFKMLKLTELDRETYVTMFDFPKILSLSCMQTVMNDTFTLALFQGRTLMIASQAAIMILSLLFLSPVIDILIIYQVFSPGHTIT